MSYRGLAEQFVWVISISSVFGCASAPSQEQMQNANYGRDLSSVECTEVAERVVADTLKDPGAAQFRNMPCSKGYWKSVPIMGMGVEFGWIQKGEVNGKNSFGGYVGFRPYQVLIRDGVAIRYCVSDQNGVCIPVAR
jgi:hypothetical protein